MNRKYNLINLISAGVLLASCGCSTQNSRQRESETEILLSENPVPIPSVSISGETNYVWLTKSHKLYPNDYFKSYMTARDAWIQNKGKEDWKIHLRVKSLNH